MTSSLTFADLIGRSAPSAASRPRPAAAPARPAPRAVLRPAPPAPAARVADDDAEMFTGSGAIRAARDLERQRMQAIVESDAGRRHPQLAIRLATTTRAPVHEALQLLEGVRAPGAPAAAQRHRPTSAAPAVAGAWDQAFRAATVAAP